MYMLLGILFILALWEAAKTAARDLREEWRKSKPASISRPGGKGASRKAASTAHHAWGFGASEALHGFPTVRHGFARGWHDARARHDKALRDREKAGADRAEARQQILSEVTGHRQRRENAQRATPGDTFPPLRIVQGDKPPAEGKPPTMPLPAPDFPPQQPQDKPQDTKPAPKEGSPMAGADITYTEAFEQARYGQQEAAEELQRVGEMRKRKPLGDLLSGAGVDDRTLSAAADYDEALREREDAAKKCEAAATALMQELQKEHGGIQQATDDAPIAKPADPNFYTH
jgi:hypothetical protein